MQTENLFILFVSEQNFGFSAKVCRHPNLFNRSLIFASEHSADPARRTSPLIFRGPECRSVENGEVE
jgi:hypothetical protein